MNKYEFTINIQALTQAEADAKMQALTTLASRLTEKELSRLSHIIRHDPVKTALAKKYLGV